MSLESKNEKNLTFSCKGFSDFRLRYKTGTNETVLQKFYILHETNHHFKEKKQPFMSTFYIVFVYVLVVIYALDLVTKDIYV